MPTNNQVAHALVDPGVAPALTVVRADGCQVTHPAPGVLVFTLPSGFGGSRESLKVTTQIQPKVVGLALSCLMFWLNQTQIEFQIVDAAGAPTDPASMWCTIEIVPRVS